MVLFFWATQVFWKRYNVLNEFMFQSHMRFCRMQWLPTRFYGSLSVYSRPLPSEKIAPFAAQLKIAFRRFLFVYTTTRKRFVIFTCRYFKLSWNTTGLNQPDCRNFSCSCIITVILVQYPNNLFSPPPKMSCLRLFIEVDKIEEVINSLNDRWMVK